MSAPFLKSIEGGIELSLLIQPRASRTRVVGLHDGLLKIQLDAPPVDGEANDALLDFLRKRLGVPRRQIELVAGDTSRRKRVRVTGIDAATAESALQQAGTA